MNKTLIEIVGWYGAAALIVAYISVSFSWLSPQSFFFQALNLTGGIAIVLHSLSRKEYPSVVINVMWALVALIALAKIL